MTVTYAVTLTLNTHPSKKGGVFNEESALQLLNKFGTIHELTYELNCYCQLHIHALIISKTNKFIKRIIDKWKKKKQNKNYSCKVDILKNESDRGHWHLYLVKSIKNIAHTRNLYYRLCKYYRTDEAIDINELADLDVEQLHDYNYDGTLKNSYFRYISSDKVRFTD